jgi:hypothetical protein
LLLVVFENVHGLPGMSFRPSSTTSWIWEPHLSVLHLEPAIRSASAWVN